VLAAKAKVLVDLEFSDFRNYTAELHGELIRCGYWDLLWRKVDVSHFGRDRVPMLKSLLSTIEYGSLTTNSVQRVLKVID
jgi:hypothetical protein